MRQALRLFVNGFVADCERSVVSQLSRTPGVERIYWLRDFVGATGVDVPATVRILDSVEVLHHEATGDHAAAIEALPPKLRRCFEEIRPVTLKMMDRLERYGPPVNQAKRERIFTNNFLYCNALIEQEGITGFVSTGVPHEITDYIFSEICRVREIPTLCFFQVQTDLITTVAHFTQLGSEEMKIRGSLTPADLSLRERIGRALHAQFNPEAEDETVAHFYMGSDSRQKVAEVTRSARRRRIKGKLSTGLRKVVSPGSWRYAYYLLYERKYHQPQLTAALKKSYASKCKDVDCTQDRYVLLFLHYQPEMTSSPLAGVFVDQYKIADLLIKALPPGVKLYVKEHPAQGIIGRSTDYYDRFPSDPRLVFVNKGMSAAKLQLNAIAIATCTGTAGYEAIWKGTPALVFGNAYYQEGPNVFRISNVDEAKRVLAEIVLRTPTVTAEELERYLHHLLGKCRVGNLSDPYFWNSRSGMTAEENAAAIVSEIRAWIVSI